jgi:VIT1/CCC1 family predicted Fe2+/Mn2+ transporter
MKIFDALLVAPVAFCIIGVLVGVLTDVPLSRVWEGVAAASMAALALHWALARSQKRIRSRR